MVDTIIGNGSRVLPVLPVIVTFISIVTLMLVLVFFRHIRKQVTQDNTHLKSDLARGVRQIEERLQYVSRLIQEQAAQYRINERCLERFDQESDLAKEVRQIGERLQHLSRLIQEQAAQYRINERRLEERFERLERQTYGGEESVVHGMSTNVPPKTAERADKCTQPQVAFQYSSVDLEKVAYDLMDKIEPEGRGSPLARLPGLKSWLSKDYPGVEAEPLGRLIQDLWLLVVLTYDRKSGVVVPALDYIIGPGEILKWFEGGRYDGTQILVRANVSAVAKVVCDEETQTWRPHSKGRIDLA